MVDEGVVDYSWKKAWKAMGGFPYGESVPFANRVEPFGIGIERLVDEHRREEGPNFELWSIRGVGDLPDNHAKHYMDAPSGFGLSLEKSARILAVVGLDLPSWYGDSPVGV